MAAILSQTQCGKTGSPYCNSSPKVLQGNLIINIMDGIINIMPAIYI